MKPFKNQARRENKQRFIPTALPKYLCDDIDDFMIKLKIGGSRASFIVNILNNYLDNQSYGKEAIATKKKEITLSPRAERHWIADQLNNPNLSKQEEKELLERYKELTKEIEKE